MTLLCLIVDFERGFVHCVILLRKKTMANSPIDLQTFVNHWRKLAQFFRPLWDASQNVINASFAKPEKLLRTSQQLRNCYDGLIVTLATILRHWDIHNNFGDVVNEVFITFLEALQSDLKKIASVYNYYCSCNSLWLLL